MVDTAVAHLFKELYFREAGEWLGEEVHRDVQKDAQGAVAASANRISVLARPTGFGPSGTHSESRLVSIEGAGDWEAGCPRTA